MYLNDLPAIESWTSAQMGGLRGACVPETVRFNGNGYYNGGSSSQNASCARASSPSYNAENVTSGAELALWIWQQYEDTGSLSFLQQFYPLMEQAAEFLLADQSVGSDGYLHAVANAHETQWAVQDPTTDLTADQALFPAVVSAATLLNTDSSLVAQLKTAEGEIEPYPRTDAATHTQLLNPQPTSATAAASADAQGNDVIADSYQPSAALRNSENIGLEPVWPWGVITDSTTVNGDNLTALADRTYNSRPSVNVADWSYDAVDAARLDMPGQVASDLVANAEAYQPYISGLSSYTGTSPGDEPYIEQSSDVATALDEALATDYDGTLRIAPAWPAGWNASAAAAPKARTAGQRPPYRARCRRPITTPAARGWPTTSPRSTAPPTATGRTGWTWRPAPTRAAGMTWAGRRPGSGSGTPSTWPRPAPTRSASGWPRPTA
jgi:hypothetical protein